MDFSTALQNLKLGRHVARSVWNWTDMYLLLADGGSFKIAGRVEGDLEPHIVMFTAAKNFVPWLASQSDILANDWNVLD